MHIVGTAGHVDHGKSALVMALTGTNPDRWIEEQVRGMTLDLGFAHLCLDDGTEAGIVDVPGHERFIHNMLAGAAGMELLLLVVASNEGVMPQTIEHLQILRYLNVAKTIVVVTKSDLLSDEEMRIARDEIAEALRDTIANGAPMLSVSSVTNDGMAELREEIANVLRSLPPRGADAPVYFPIDRVFTLPGIGTIVTGTLMQGVVSVGDRYAVAPSGAPVRLRSLQVFGRARDRAESGTRVALNLPGIAHSELRRGDVLADPKFAAQTSYNVRFTPLPEAIALLRRRTPVRVAIGSAEILGTLVCERAPNDESELKAQLHLRTPVLAFPGGRFVVRRVSPKTLLGGGEIVGTSEGAPAKANDAVENVLAAMLRERGLQATETAQAAFLTNLREDAARGALDALADRGDAVRISRPDAYVDAAAAHELLRSALDALTASEHAQPWAMGQTSLALSRALTTPEPLLIRILGALAEDGRIAFRGGYYATPAYQATLTPEQKAFFESAVPEDVAQPFVPSTFEDVAAAMKTSLVVGLSRAFDTLLARGALVRVGDDIYRSSQISAAHARVAAYLAANGRMTMADFRTLLGTSRKYAVPLLEWFDAHGITLRDGDYRHLRSKPVPRD